LPFTARRKTKTKASQPQESTKLFEAFFDLPVNCAFSREVVCQKSSALYYGIKQSNLC
jgi:hypothetical protein